MTHLNLKSVKSVQHTLPINLGSTKKRNQWTTKLAIEKIKANHAKSGLKLMMKGTVK